jgi:micrococcal nuclease
MNISRILFALVIAVTASSAMAQKKPKPKPVKPRVEFFANCKALNRKYPNGVPIGHPAYRPKLDRNKDKWACER